MRSRTLAASVALACLCLPAVAQEPSGIPYAWRGAAASSTTPISVGFTITGSPSLRTSVQGVALLSKVPASGSTTSFALNATI